MGLGDGFKKVAVSVKIDQADIEGNSNIWTNSTNAGGEIDFCVVMAFFLNENCTTLVQFMETEFKIIVDMT